VVLQRASGAMFAILPEKQHFETNCTAISYFLILQYIDNEKMKKEGKDLIDDSPDSLELRRLARTVSWLSLPSGVM